MTYRLLFSLLVFGLSANAQNWSAFLDTSRAIDWTSAGFTIPNYTTNCSTQPPLTANNPSAAAANTTAIQDALNSCDATHNVVNIPAGSYYVNGWTYPSHGHQVVRGAGPNSTTLALVGISSCNNWPQGVCIGADTGIYWGGPSVQPGASNQCAWSAGYAQGATTITLNTCGSAPPNNTVLVLDQANDAADTGGVFICDDSSYSGCNYEGSGNANGRQIGGVTHSQQQSTLITSVTSLGGGSYSVTISPGVYFTNVRSGQSPGAWWSGYGLNAGMNNGLENLSVDQTNAPDPIGFFNCYQCWIKNIRSMYGGRNHVNSYQSFQNEVRDSYFYGSQEPGATQSYGVELETATSALVVENNIFEQVTAPIMFGQGSGDVVGYNFVLNNQSGATNMGFAYYGHNAGNEMNLWEGNNLNGINADDSWGSMSQGTYFRNMISAWQLGKNQYTYGISIEGWDRAFNVAGNVLGQPGYDVTYESYATSTTSGVNGGDAVDTSIYALGWTGISGWGGCGTPPVCGPLVRPTLMRWGNWDVVNNATQWNATEASPAAVTYINANFTSSYFGTLAHTLPNSLYYTSKPSWWPATKAWPPIGPDVTTGNLGLCTGTYAGTQAITASQCAVNGGTGTLGSVQYASHVVSIPAQDCFLNTMGGPPDGSGNVLAFDANTCYTTTSTPAVSPTSLGPWTTAQVISRILTASNFTGTVTWSKLSGTAPTGLSGTCITGTTGTICTLTGTLSAAGSFSFTIRATNGTSTVDTPFTITVNAVPSITSSGSLPAGMLGQAYSQALSTSGGTAPLNCSVATGSLPSGLSFSGCTISGTPSAIGTSTFTAIATDANGTVSSASASLSITVTVPVGITLLSTTYCQPGISWPSTSPYTACNLTAAAPAGSTIIAGFATYNSAGTSSTMTGVTDGNGDTFLQVANARSTSTQSGAGYWDDFWYLPNVPAQVTSVSPKPSQTVNGNLFVWVVSNVNSVNAAGAENATTSTSSTPVGAAVTTTAAATFIAALLHPDINGSPTTVNAPFISDSVVDGMGWAHLIASSTGTYAPQWNQTATTYAGSTVAFSSSSQTPPASPTGLTATVH